jgi:hypothetical protein
MEDPWPKTQVDDLTLLWTCCLHGVAQRSRGGDEREHSTRGKGKTRFQRLVDGRILTRNHSVRDPRFGHLPSRVR